MGFKVLGGGNMGSAMVKAALDQGVFSKEETVIFEKMPEKVELLKRELGCQVSLEAMHLEPGDILMVAVKPQNYQSPLSWFKADSTNLIISIMAGISTEAIQDLQPEAQVIRVMPNMPASIGSGMSVYFGNEKVTETSFQITAKLLDACGKSMKVDSENMIDASTAISGSGPAYLFYLAEQMALAAIDLGFTAEQAELLSTQTVYGSSELLDQSAETAETLRKQVTSPGGTTAAAIGTMDSMECNRIINKALKSAYNRARELGGH